MPTPSHTIRIEDEVWDPADSRAKQQGEHVTAVIKRALQAYVHGPSWQDRALAAEAEVRRLKGQQ